MKVEVVVVEVASCQKRPNGLAVRKRQSLDGHGVGGDLPASNIAASAKYEGFPVSEF